MGRVSNKVAVVTGSASGLGLCSSRFLVQEGAQVVMTDIRAEEGLRAAEGIGEKAFFIQHDVTSEDQWKSVMSETLERFGKLDILVNSAGISEPADIEEETLEHWRRIQRINLESVFLGCKYGVEAMKKSGGGSIINIGSGFAIRSDPMIPAYSASKGGVRQLTKSVALHCGQQGYNIRCNVVHPGMIHTPMSDVYFDRVGKREASIKYFDSLHPIGHCGQPEDIAYAVVFLASDESKFVTGADYCVDGGITI